MVAYWISPDGEIINVESKHITTVIKHPDKFGFNREFIEFIYNNYGERIGQEGKAREQILNALFKQNWIRIRKYKNFWSMNLKVLAGKAKSYVTQGAKKILKGLHGFKELDSYIPIKVDQKSQPMKTVILKDMTMSDKFIPEHSLIEKNIEDMKSLPLNPLVNEMMNRRMSFKEYLNES